MSYIPSSYIDDGVSDTVPTSASPKPKATPCAWYSRTLPLRKEMKHAETTTVAWAPSEYSAIDDSSAVVDTATTNAEATERPTQQTKQEEAINWEAGSVVESFIDDGESITGQPLAQTEINAIQEERRYRPALVLQETPEAPVVVRRLSLPPQAPRAGPVLLRRALVDNTTNNYHTPSKANIIDKPSGIPMPRPPALPAFIILNKTKAVTVIDPTYPPVVPRRHLRSLTYPEKLRNQALETQGERLRASSAPAIPPTNTAASVPSVKPPKALFKGVLRASQPTMESKVLKAASTAPNQAENDVLAESNPSTKVSSLPRLQPSPNVPSATHPRAPPQPLFPDLPDCIYDSRSKAKTHAPSKQDEEHMMSGAVQTTPPLSSAAMAARPAPPDAPAEKVPLGSHSNIALHPPPHSSPTPVPLLHHQHIYVPQPQPQPAPPPPPPPMPDRPSNYRAPYVEDAASNTSSSGSAAATIGDGAGGKEDGYVRLRRRTTGEQPYCNAVVGGIPVRMAEWRGKSEQRRG